MDNGQYPATGWSHLAEVLYVRSTGGNGQTKTSTGSAGREIQMPSNHQR